ncbi:hypothetical protein KDU71_07520 [Carboxylicivirga sediminis]|uniref:Uncharacterized protein n=1 Tax=Carboxylicivirga sediminis TaxID=2006564 RepID=A0A941F492_9BACT|nr:hypothetical protein [Carboxylicivirga sediminis]MBR8535405.1 hypothetical protein [Carboxylicivirga sediminis]
MNDSIWCGIYCFIRDNAAILVAFMSFVVSVLALRYTVRAGKKEQEHKELSVKPFICLLKKPQPTGEFQCIIENNGIGPAIIKRVIYYWLDEEFDSCEKFWDAFIHFVRGKVSIGFRNVARSVINKDVVLKEGANMNIVKGELICSNKAEFKTFINFFNGIRIRVEFQDLYGNEFLFDTSKKIINEQICKKD